MSIKNSRSHKVIEQILKEFLSYLESIKEKCSSHYQISDIHHDWEAPNEEKLRRIPWSWSNDEAKKHRDKLKAFGRAMGEYMHRLPKENNVIKRILDSMKGALREGINEEGSHYNRHIGILIESITKLLRVLQPVDLERLVKLMKKNQAAGNEMVGKEVVLLIGGVGCGKTTTLHYLAGTTFDEVEVDGFFHLQPIKYAHPTMKELNTSCGREPATRSIQTARVKIDGKDIVLCDTPGFGESDDVEENIANGLGIVRALHKAEIVRPVLVLSREGMGDRFTAFADTFSSVARLMGNQESVDLSPFNYVFTKYEKRHRSCMCRQFILIRKRPLTEEEGQVVFKTFLDDIILKTTPEAKIALPMEGNPQSLLRSIIYDVCKVTDPKNYFVPFVSETSLKKLKLQLQITLRDVMTALLEEDYDLSEYRMDQLCKLALVLPEAGECAQLALEATLRHVAVARERVLQIALKIEEVKIHKQFTQLMDAFNVEIKKVLATEELRQICERFEIKSHAPKKRTPGKNEIFCADQVKNTVKLISADVPDFDPDFLNTEALMRQRGSFLTAVIRLKEMAEICHGVPAEDYVTAMYKKAFDQFYTFVRSVLCEAEENFHSSLPKDLQSFERQAWFLAVLIQGFLNRPNSGSGEHAKMEELENRRLKLMLRVEIKISDTIELITNTRFPDGHEEGTNPDSIPIVKLSGLRQPRQLLLSVSQLPRLCKFLPSQLESSEVGSSVALLDRKIITFFERLVIKADSIVSRIDEKRAYTDLESSLEGTLLTRRDLRMVLAEFLEVRQWSNEIEEETAESWNRLLIVKEAVESSIRTIEANLEASRNLGFACGMLPSKYLCANSSNHKCEQ